MNTLRVSTGLPALIEDPIVNAVAQSTARSWPPTTCPGISGMCAVGWLPPGTGLAALSGRRKTLPWAAGAWASMGSWRPGLTRTICARRSTRPIAMWARVWRKPRMDASITSCRLLTFPGRSAAVRRRPHQEALPNRATVPNPVSQLIVPVKIATPDADGKIYHVVQAGQSFWSIAIAYQITIHDLESLEQHCPGIHPCNPGRNYSSRGRTRKATPRRLPMA